jgi:hypothetical protein
MRADARVDAPRPTCYNVMQVKRLADTASVTRSGAAASLPACFSYFWRFS